MEVAAGLGGAAGLVGALLYYFGWARTAALFDWFGVDVGVLDLSFQDYLLRSVGSAFWPLTTLGVVALLAVGADRLLVRSRWRVALGRALAVVGAVLVAVGLAAVARWITFLTDWPVVPVGMLAGAILVLYGLHRARDRNGDRGARRLAWRLPVAVVLVMLTFWSAAAFAGYRGVSRAHDIAERPYRSPGVLVFSTEDLRLHGAGVEPRQVGPAGAPYAWCYGGLRLLIRSGGRHLLLPEHWRRGRDPVLVVAEGDGLRVEYLAGRAPSSCP